MKFLTIIFLFTTTVLTAQIETDCSLFLRSDSSNYLSNISSEDGDLFKKLGHHGPAIENDRMALRLYFDDRMAIDVYSKQRKGVELKEFKWYPTQQQQNEGSGADYYKVGKTVGLGGIRLWDGEKVISLYPVSSRTAKVKNEGTTSYMEILSEGIPYNEKKIDILVRVTVFSGMREAKVEAFALTDEKVQFVTGVNYHEGNKVVKGSNYILNWGLHPEDVTSDKIELGAVLFFENSQFEKQVDDGTQQLLISHPVKKLEYWVSSTSQRDEEINNLKKFIEYASKQEIN